MITGAVLALVSACAPQEPPPPAAPLDLRVRMAPDVLLASGSPVVVPQADGLQRVSLVLANPFAQDRPVMQRIEWFDVEGQPVSSNLSSPRRMTVPRFGEAVVTGIAPQPRAVSFRIVIERDPLASGR
jgi:uncharacterized protein YcfL